MKSNKSFNPERHALRRSTHSKRSFSSQLPLQTGLGKDLLLICVSISHLPCCVRQFLSISSDPAHANDHRLRISVKTSCEISESTLCLRCRNSVGQWPAVREFQEFAKEFDFLHITSSPHHAQGKGHTERGVEIAKKILKQKDPLLALMSYRHKTG